MVTSNNGAEKYLKNLDKNLRLGLELAAQLVEHTAQKYAPEFTTTMAASVSHTKAEVIDGNLSVFIGPGTEAPYAEYTELPQYTAGKNLGPISVAKGTAQMPWLVPALKTEEKSVKEIIYSAVRNTRA